MCLFAPPSRTEPPLPLRPGCYLFLKHSLYNAHAHRRHMTASPPPTPPQPDALLAGGGDVIERINADGCIYERLAPVKTVEISWEVKRKKNNRLIVRRIKKKIWHHRFVTYQPHPSKPDSLLKGTRTMRRVITSRDTVRRLDSQTNFDLLPSPSPSNL